MGFRQKRDLRLGAWFSLLALAVQVFLPFLIAADIRVVTAQTLLDAPFDPAVTCLHGTPASNPASDHAPLPPHHQAACPLCLALAAAHGFTSTAAPALSPPADHPTTVSPNPAAPFYRFSVRLSYNARAPPVLG